MIQVTLEFLDQSKATIIDIEESVEDFLAHFRDSEWMTTTNARGVTTMVRTSSVRVVTVREQR